jgi:lipopolysaccharide export system permease protein
MNLLQRYLIRQFIPVFIFSVLFFVLLLELGDLFANLWKYLANGVSAASMLKILLLYAPKCVSYSIPLAVLFAASYTIGSMHARNELIMVFSSGYPLYTLVAPLLAIGFMLSIGMYYFEDLVVIETYAKKNQLSKVLLKQEDSRSNTNIVILSDSGKTIYAADYYQDDEKKLYSVFVILRDDNGGLLHVVKAPVLSWIDGEWKPDFYEVYSVDANGDFVLTTETLPVKLTEQPVTFRRNTTSVDEIRSAEAKKYIAGLRKAGVPYAEQLSNYYKRFSFPLTVFIVLFFSISVGGRFRKNILLMSILLSLSIAVLYYVTQMVTMLFAKWEYISPLAGAWFPAILFGCLAILIARYART